MVGVMKLVRTRPGLMHRNSDSLTSMRTYQGKSLSSSSLKSTNSRNNNTKSCSVCFALDYDTPDEAFPPPETTSEEEAKLCFYTAADLHRFDKDRALTVLMYRTRKNNGVAWDDNVHSIRGLEEILSKTKYEKSRRTKRRDHVKALLHEQDRLKSEAGREELAVAAKAIKKTKKDLAMELLRGVSCCMSKGDKQRALSLAMKDENASSSSRHGSARKLLQKVKGKFLWSSTSSRSLNAADK